MTAMADKEAEACRQLWCAVLLIGVRDILNVTAASPAAIPQLRNRASSWLGSSSYRLVCDLAGVDARRLEAAVRRLMAQPLRYTTDGRVAKLVTQVRR